MQETLAFVDALVNDKPAPCTGEDGLVALVMAIAAGTSATEQRWVELKELAVAGMQLELNVEIEHAAPPASGWNKTHP